ncbi:hypothetical protein ACFL2Q_04290 [Thermodesulfobacteriota bacterium]
MAIFTRKDFLEALFRQYFSKHNGFIMTKVHKRLDHRISTRYYPTIERLAKEPTTDDSNVFFGICPRERMKPGVENIRYLPALWAGLDMGPEGYSGGQTYFAGPSRAAKAVRSFPIPPSIIVESGHGIHLYWLLNRMIEIAEVDRVNLLLRKINDYFQCPKSVDISSAMRLPGTVNTKLMGEFVNCSVKYINNSFRYDLEEFEKLDFTTLYSSVEASRSHSRPIPSTPRSTGQHQTYLGDSGSIDKEEVEDFLARDVSRKEYAGQAPSDVQSAQQNEVEVSTITLSAHDVSTAIYEAPTILGSAQPNEPANWTADDLADLVAERVLEKLKDQLIDEIVDRLVKRLSPPGIDS